MSLQNASDSIANSELDLNSFAPSNEFQVICYNNATLNVAADICLMNRRNRNYRINVFLYWFLCRPLRPGQPKRLAQQQEGSALAVAISAEWRLFHRTFIRITYGQASPHVDVAKAFLL